LTQDVRAVTRAVSLFLHRERLSRSSRVVGNSKVIRRKLSYW
jgi:hypothetical protein